MMISVNTHHPIQPKVLYFGYPVILLTTENEDGSTNISPISSSWALGRYLVLGLGVGGKALENIRQRPECVLNLPDPRLWQEVEALAPLTGMNPVPAYKVGFRYVKDKFKASGLTPEASAHVKPLRIKECPLQIEAVVRDIRLPDYDPAFAIVEVEAVQTHAHEEVILRDNYINPSAWSPLIYNFRHYFGLGGELGKSFRSET
ncbi:flavin reductase family protein [Brevibacillus ginsengisoli]|uniref:flavin reductase family protein n=1 Tax=Brevibacillus ginsengisoli TaxID=363854 RepID=UPI003CF5A807